MNRNKLLGNRILDVLMVIFVLEIGFLVDEKFKNCFYDMFVIEDNKVWMGEYSIELKLFDFLGYFYYIVSIFCIGMYLCMYN